MNETELRTRLRRMRLLATGLLILMALVYLAARPLRAGHPAWGLAAAFAEAAMVGALADWFAVTALFRHPLGVPIPHTAIIPRNKERLAISIENFIDQHFMTPVVIRAELERVDFSGTAADWLSRPANRAALATHAAAALPPILRLVGEGTVREWASSSLARATGRVHLAPLLAQLLTVLVQGRQHHILLERFLGIVARALERNRPFIRQKVHDSSPRWMPKAVDDKLYERLMEGVSATLIEIQGEDSEWRDRFQAATEELIGKLGSSPEYEHKLQDLARRALEHPLFQQYAGQLWLTLRQRLEDDAAAPQSRLAVHLASVLEGLADALRREPAWQARVNDWLRDFGAAAIVERRHAILGVVRRVIGAWSGDEVARRFELYVGRDLQFIRINGTLVGGCVGLVLHFIETGLS